MLLVGQDERPFLTAGADEYGRDEKRRQAHSCHASQYNGRAGIAGAHAGVGTSMRCTGPKEA